MRIVPRTSRNGQRGVAAVEFGILLVPLVLMLFGLTEYGRAIYQYNTLVKASRDAARYLSSVAPGNATNEWDKAKCIAIHGNSECTGPLLVANLDASMVAVCDRTNCPDTHSSVKTTEGSVNLVTVTITRFEFVSLINFPVGGLSVGAPDITFGDISNTMRQTL